MKKLIFLFCVLSLALAQNEMKYGLRIGQTYGVISNNSTTDTEVSHSRASGTSFQFGLDMLTNISTDLDVKVLLAYDEKVFASQKVLVNTSSTQSLNYLSLYLLANYNRSKDVFFSFGPSFSYFIGGESVDIVKGNTTYTPLSKDDATLAMALNIGVGFNIKSGNNVIVPQIVYGHALNYLSKISEVAYYNTVTVSLGFQL